MIPPFVAITRIGGLEDGQVLISLYEDLLIIFPATDRKGRCSNLGCLTKLLAFVLFLMTQI